MFIYTRDTGALGPFALSHHVIYIYMYVPYNVIHIIIYHYHIRRIPLVGASQEAHWVFLKAGYTALADDTWYVSLSIVLIITMIIIKLISLLPMQSSMFACCFPNTLACLSCCCYCLLVIIVIPLFVEILYRDRKRHHILFMFSYTYQAIARILLPLQWPTRRRSATKDRLAKARNHI